MRARFLFFFLLILLTSNIEVFAVECTPELTQSECEVLQKFEEVVQTLSLSGQAHLVVVASNLENHDIRQGLEVRVLFPAEDEKILLGLTGQTERALRVLLHEMLLARYEKDQTVQQREIRVYFIGNDE